MNRITAVIITLLIMVLPLPLLLMAAAPGLIIPPRTLTGVEINWTACPTSTDIGIAETVWLDSITFGVAGTARTVTLADRQASPITVITAVSIPANQFTHMQLNGVRFASGFTLSCSGAGVVYQFKGKVRR